MKQKLKTFIAKGKTKQTSMVETTGHFLTNIRNLIAQNEFTSAIQQLHILLKHSPKLTEVLIQSARYQDVLQQIRLGTIEFEQANVTKNKIRLGLLELVGEIEQQKDTPTIKTELEQAISIVNSKNIVIGSTITTTSGEVQIGDRTINTESDLSKGLRVFLYLFVPFLAIVIAYLWYHNQVLKTPLQLKVRIENKTPNQELPDPNGLLVLNYGIKTESKEVTKEFIFEGIPPSFKNETLRLKYTANGFVEIDTSFLFTGTSIDLPLYRNDDLAAISGYVYDYSNKSPLNDVTVSLPCCKTKTDLAGFFQLKIPFEHQRSHQRIELFKKDYQPKSTTTPVFASEWVKLYLSKK